MVTAIATLTCTSYKHPRFRSQYPKNQYHVFCPDCYDTHGHAYAQPYSRSWPSNGWLARAVKRVQARLLVLPHIHVQWRSPALHLVAHETLLPMAITLAMAVIRTPTRTHPLALNTSPYTYD